MIKTWEYYLMLCIVNVTENSKITNLEPLVLLIFWPMVHPRHTLYEDLRHVILYRLCCVNCKINIYL